MSGPCQGDCTYEKQDSCQEFSWAAGYVSHMAVCEGGRYYTLHHKAAGCASSGGDVRNDTEQGHPYGMECSMFDENEQHSTCTSAGSSPGISSPDDYYDFSGGSHHGEDDPCSHLCTESCSVCEPPCMAGGLASEECKACAETTNCEACISCHMYASLFKANSTDFTNGTNFTMPDCGQCIDASSECGECMRRCGSCIGTMTPLR